MTGILHDFGSADPAVCKVPVTHQMTLPSMSPRSSVDRGPARCSRGHGFNSYWGVHSDFFFVPPSCHVDQLTFHIYDNDNDKGLLQIPTIKRLFFCNISTRCSGGHGFVPVGDSEFFFVPCSCHVDQFIFHISFPSSKFTIFIHLSCNIGK